MFSGLWLHGTKFRMPPAFPMDDQNDLACAVIDVGNDVFDQRSEQFQRVATLAEI